MQSLVHCVLQDVVYFFQPEEDCLVTIATCNSAQFVDDFDTVLYVLGNATGPGLMEVVACNDDACSYLSQLQVKLNCCLRTAAAMMMHAATLLSYKSSSIAVSEQQLQ